MIYLSFSQQLDLHKNLRCYSEMYMFKKREIVGGNPQ